MAQVHATRKTPRVKFTGFMKSAAVVAALWFALIAPGWAQPSGEIEHDLLRIQDEWAVARVKRDIPYLERLYAKEFRIQSMDGSVVSREADIAVFASGELKPDLVEDQDMEVSIYGDTALVTGIENVAGTYKGNYGAMALRFINVFVRRDGRWQLVAHQSTLVPKT